MLVRLWSKPHQSWSWTTRQPASGRPRPTSWGRTQLLSGGSDRRWTSPTPSSCSSAATTCARAQRSTPHRSPSCWPRSSRPSLPTRTEPPLKGPLGERFRRGPSAVADEPVRRWVLHAVCVEVGRKASTARVAQLQSCRGCRITLLRCRSGCVDDLESEARCHQDLRHHLQTLRPGIALEARQPGLADADLLGELALAQPSSPAGRAQGPADLGDNGFGLAIRIELIHASTMLGRRRAVHAYGVASGWWGNRVDPCARLPRDRQITTATRQADAGPVPWRSPPLLCFAPQQGAVLTPGLRGSVPRLGAEHRSRTEHISAHHGCRSQRGRWTTATIPVPEGLSCNEIDPPERRTSSRTMASPRPVPPASRSRASSSRANLSNTRSRSAAGMPGPSSATVSTACPPSACTSRDTAERAWRTALSTRLASTRRSSSALAAAYTAGPVATVTGTRALA